jgi:hypothetical protein
VYICTWLSTRVHRLQFRVVKSSGSWPFAHVVWLVAAVVVVLCFGVFLSLPAAPESEVFPAFTTAAGSPHADQVANGYRHLIDGNYLAASAEDDEASDELPENATLLTTLLVVVFFGRALGWLLAFGSMRRRLKVPSFFGCCFPSIVRHHQRRPVATLLGVFRL